MSGVSSVAREIATVRRPAPAAPGTARSLVNRWREKESLHGERVHAFVAILRTRGCYWADVKGCSMCGYSRDTLGRSATPEELEQQRVALAQEYQGEPYVKLYTSGSFLDDREVDPASRVAIARTFQGRARRLLFETLPEFVSAETISPLLDAFGGEIEVAMGLESTQADVLRRFVTKGSSPLEYLEAADRAARLGAHPKGYLLLKPPYLTEREAIEDTVRSVAAASGHFETLSINPVHIQNGTVVEWLYRRGRYRPPWLWSLVEAMRRGSEQRAGARLVTFPTAGGQPRGPHNCGNCDRSVLAALEDASLDQRFDRLVGLRCDCQREWQIKDSIELLGVEA